MNDKISKLILRLNELSDKQNEENVRVYTSYIIEEILSSIGLKNDQMHEYTFINGSRADSMYQNIIIEYKRYNAFRHKRNVTEAVNGRKSKADSGLKNYLIQKANESQLEGIAYNKYLSNFVGVGFDGATFIFCRYKLVEDNNLEFETIIESNLDHGFKKLTMYLRSLHKEVITHESLTKHFGSASDITRKAILGLYNELDKADSNRVLTLYQEWNRIFGDIYGDVETENTAFKNELFKKYGLSNQLDVRKTLFVLQTYYNIVLKALVINLLKTIENPYFDMKNVGQNKQSIIETFEGKSLFSKKINNFFEVYYFEWFMYQDGVDFDFLIDVFSTMNELEATQSILKPEMVHDVLKEFYENLIPKKLRHLLGEYYTPGWFVDFTLEKVGYSGGLNEKLLDPTCGSGSFLTHAIKQVKENNSDIAEEELIKQITNNIVGYDINPIAVISAKTNYLLAMGDISNVTGSINIPIYMCDSTLVPTVYAKQQRQTHSINVETIAGKFELPVLENREQMDIFLNLLSKNIRFENKINQFIKELNNSQIFLENVSEEVVIKFYTRIEELHRAGKNGYWPTILKNSFAPLFEMNSFDFVVGNPPWVSWKNMSDTYRQRTLDIWLSYGIFEKSAYDKITTHDDFAMAVTYVSIDHYLSDKGKLAFILPQQFLKSAKGGEGFRKFKLTSDEQDINLSVESVYDFLKVNPFKESASNRASLLIFKRSCEMIYPMHNYIEMSINEEYKLKATAYYSDVKKMLIEDKKSAIPVNDNIKSPWLTFDKKNLLRVRSVLGQSAYRGRKGIEVAGAKGIYLLDILNASDNTYIIENLLERSRLKEVLDMGVHRGEVEKELIFPLLSGRNISKWGINSNTYIVVPHDIEGKSIYTGMNEEMLYQNYPLTFEWLDYFKDVLLRTRIRNGKFYNPKTQPYYRLDNIGPYIHAPFYVVWREQSKNMMSCVTGNMTNEFLNNKKILVDSKVLFCPLESEDEAYYLAGMLNSDIVNDIVTSYTIDIQKGIDILKNIAIPEYKETNELHIELKELSKLAHNNFVEGLNNEVVEKKVNKVVKEIFKLKD